MRTAHLRRYAAAVSDEPTNAELLAFMRDQFARLSAQIDDLRTAAGAQVPSRRAEAGASGGQEPLRGFLMPADDEDGPAGGVAARVPG